jgi:hypothetical protein
MTAFRPSTPAAARASAANARFSGGSERSEQRVGWNRKFDVCRRLGRQQLDEVTPLDLAIAQDGRQ